MPSPAPTYMILRSLKSPPHSGVLLEFLGGRVEG